MSRIRYGMVGGGPGAFIGAVHRMAAALDGEYSLVAGAFSSDPAKSSTQGVELGLDPTRIYDSWEAMVDGESRLPPEERIQAVVIVTPNFLHFPVAKAFLEADVHVICDKPLTLTVEEAETLCRLTAARNRVFCVTHNYTGYPLVKEARERVRRGELGELRKVVVEYSQGWLSTLLEAEGQKQAEWRADPARAGISSALGDIGSHAHNLMEYVTGQRITRVLADLGTVVEGRTLEDDANILFRTGQGVRGLLFASQIAVGERNHLRLRVYGTKGALDWCQEDPNDLRILESDGSERILHTGGGTLSDEAQDHTRLPGGHPEGFIEAFANLYRNAAGTIRLVEGEEGADPAHAGDFPTVADGARGVHFIHACVESAGSGQWVDADYQPPGERG